MTRVVGCQDRDEFELDPLEAHRRGRKLDRMLRVYRPPQRPMVLRAIHSELNRLDEQRALEAARRVNTPA